MTIENPDRLWAFVSGPQSSIALHSSEAADAWVCIGVARSPVVAEYVLASVASEETAALRREREALESAIDDIARAVGAEYDPDRRAHTCTAEEVLSAVRALVKQNAMARVFGELRDEQIRELVGERDALLKAAGVG